MAKIAVFPGSFSPFTIGHQSVIDRAIPLFDKIIVAIGINSEKNQYFSIEERIQWITEIYSAQPKIEIKFYEGLTVDFCKKENARFILRGLRDSHDFKFEKNDPTLFFLQRLRDESHRFAVSAHRAKRKKGISKSLLDQIDGVGSIRKRALLNHFGSARAVESASLDEIKTVEGVEEKVANKIYNYFHE